MKIYSIFEPATGPVRLDDPRSVIFLKEGFCWPALFAPFVWLLYHRMWLLGAAYVGVSIVVALLGQWLGSDGAPAAIIGLGSGLIVAWEANGLRRWHLARTLYRQVATIAADDLQDAEARYFSARPAAPSASVPAPVSGPPAGLTPGFERRQASAGWGFMAPDYTK
jgi:hypothetical protein